MKIKALWTVKYKGKRYPPGSIITLSKGDENLAESKSVEVISESEKTKVSSDEKRGNNTDGDISQRSRKKTSAKGGGGD